MNRYRHADSTLKSMTKDELIKYVRMCEHNQEVAEETVAQQAKNFETMFKDWQPIAQAKWITDKEKEYRKICSECNNIYVGFYPPKYCPHCGAKMNLE